MAKAAAAVSLETAKTADEFDSSAFLIGRIGRTNHTVGCLGSREGEPSRPQRPRGKAPTERSPAADNTVGHLRSRSHLPVPSFRSQSRANSALHARTGDATAAIPVRGERSHKTTGENMWMGNRPMWTDGKSPCDDASSFTKRRTHRHLREGQLPKRESQTPDNQVDRRFCESLPERVSA